MANDLNAFLKDLSKMTQEQEEQRNRGDKVLPGYDGLKRVLRFIEGQIVTESLLQLSP